MKTFIMLNSDWTHTKMNGVYTVQATSYDEARRKIVEELSPKIRRHPILNYWLKEGQPLRIMGERNSTTFSIPFPDFETAAAYYQEHGVAPQVHP